MSRYVKLLQERFGKSATERYLINAVADWVSFRFSEQFFYITADDDLKDIRVFFRTKKTLKVSQVIFEFFVKDGIVSESDILKDTKLEDLIPIFSLRTKRASAVDLWDGINNYNVYVVNGKTIYKVGLSRL